MKHFSLVLVLLLVSATGVQALTFSELEPAWAEVGADVKLNGVGFDPLETYTVTVSGVNAPVQEVQAGFIRFTVPVGAATGPVAVDDGSGGDPLLHRSSLTVVRTLNATFAASVPGSTAAYAVGTVFGDSLSAVGPVFPVTISRGEPTLVISSRLEAEPVFMAVTTDTSISAELSAESTANALVFLIPMIFTPDVTEADVRLGLIAPLTETQTLTDLIQANLAASTDYLEDPAFDNALVDAVVATMDAIAALPGPRIQELQVCL